MFFLTLCTHLPKLMRTHISKFPTLMNMAITWYFDWFFWQLAKQMNLGTIVL
jgi:hypothetical protein